MLQENTIKEALSLSYIKAISYYAGYTAGKSEFDYGVDLTIQDIETRPSGRTYESGIRLGIQLKSTENFRETESEIIYDLKNKNYNDLIAASTATPRILVLLCLPDQKREWIKQDVNSLIMKKCAFWKYFGGEQAVSDIDSTTAVRIPKQNIFSPEKLQTIMNTIKNGRELNGI